MFGSVVLELAIGLGLLYAVLSIVSSAVTEMLATLFSMRARTLRNAIVHMLGGVEASGNVLLAHPRIRGLAPRRPFAGRARGLPDYIPPKTFATALFETLFLFRQPGTPASSAELVARISEVEPPPLRRTLESLVNEVGLDAANVRKAVEGWYDDVMARARAVYTSRALTIAMVVAFLAVVLVNADTVMFSRQIWENGNLRAALVTRAENLQFEEPDGGLGFLETVAILQLYPLGWSSDPQDPRALPRTLPGALTKLGGFLLTLLAVSMGAPFWFDTLKRFVGLRSGRLPSGALADAAPEKPSVEKARELGPAPTSTRPIQGRTRAQDSPVTS